MIHSCTELYFYTDYGLNKEDPDVKTEVTQLGLTYNILTPYTSFIAVTETVRNPGKDSTDVKFYDPLLHRTVFL